VALVALEGAESFVGLVLLLESLVDPLLLLVAREFPVALVALVVTVLLLVALDSLVGLVLLLVPVLLLVALESTVVLVISESLVVPVLLLVAVESLVALEVIERIIASACDSVETIEAALAIHAVKELMEEEMVLEVVVDD
jgi:hypothetical protein